MWQLLRFPQWSRLENYFIISLRYISQVETRTEKTLKTLDAAKEAGIKHIIFLSVFFADTDTTFGKHYKPMEAKLKSMGVPYTNVSTFNYYYE